MNETPVLVPREEHFSATNKNNLEKSVTKNNTEYKSLFSINKFILCKICIYNYILTKLTEFLPLVFAVGST